MNNEQIQIICDVVARDKLRYDIIKQKESCKKTACVERSMIKLGVCPNMEIGALRKIR